MQWRIERHARLSVHGLSRQRFAILIGAMVTSLFGCVHDAGAQPGGSRTPLSGNHPAEAASLGSHAPADQVLSIDIAFAPGNRAELRRLLSELQDPASPRYHRWLTRAQFESRFGRTGAEIEAIRAWLMSNGFRVVQTSAREIRSTATVAQAETAFGTTIAASSDGSVFGNVSDPRIPAQFAGVIGAIRGLDNLLRSTPLGIRPVFERSPPQAAVNPAMKSIEGYTGGQRSPRLGAVVSIPQYKGARGLGFGPSDLWSFYDETPLRMAGINGKGGDCVALVETSDYPDSSVRLFNSNFALPAASIARFYPDGSSPGINSAELEALLDIEWAHAVAPGAAMRVYMSLDLAEAIRQAIEDNACGAISAIT